MSLCRMLAVAAAGFVVGCADFRNYCDTQLVASRNHHLARVAFGERGADLCEGRKHYDHFRDGFYAGYYNVASGEGGVAPLVPPEKYWAACYQDADGREMTNDWFAGFNEGTFAAAQDGVGEMNELATWAGDQCCDDQGRNIARREVGPRKPRRGDPPIRATLPPPAPKKELPQNSEGVIKDRPTMPIDETPLPSEIEKLEQTPTDAESPTSKKKPTIPQSDSALPKKDGVQKRKNKSATASVAERKSETRNATPTALRSPRRESVEAKESHSSDDLPLLVESKRPKSVDSLQSDSRDAIPINPSFKQKPAPNYPVAPPLLQTAAMKSSTSLGTSEPKRMATMVINNDDDDGPLPPPPAKPLVLVETPPKALEDEPSPLKFDSPLKIIHGGGDPIREVAKSPVRELVESAWKAHSTTPKVEAPTPERKPEASGPEDGWKTPHDRSKGKRSSDED